MKSLLVGAALAALATAAAAQTDPQAPRGRLSDAVKPAAYRLDLTVVPDQPRFSGHVEIDVSLKQGLSQLYMHGRDLNVTRAVAKVGGRTVPATWTQVDPTGVVRLDFARPLSAGVATLAFDYDAPFGDSPSGMYHIKVADRWYAWTQFESIDARAAFPSFDEPGFKTPFSISIATSPGLKTISNAPEASVTRAGDLEVHRFAPTRPLPTYLVAMDTGPFVHPTAMVSPDPERARPLPLGAVAAQAQAGRLGYVLTETPRIVQLLEGYFGQPFPFPKLDQIGSPEMPGAMENAGADTYADDIIELDRGATTGQKQTFGMVVAHELSHQWFGDLVSPEWWDDIWLNESFANWMGYRIGDVWRPELHIAVGALDEGFRAMNTDALEAGRPIHQHIATNSEIDSAFDSITYGKGGQVIAMIAAYMGDDRFKEGVRLHLSRHAYGNANTEQFFQALADAGRDPRILEAMKSFVDQQGVPLVTFTRAGGGLVATQSRYGLLGGSPKPTTWIIPLCLKDGTGRRCVLLDRQSAPVAASATGPLMPNAGGTGYYRFELPAADWATLISALPTLSAGEALAADDSLWASFRAGRAPASSLVAEMRSLLRHPDASVSVSAGQRFAGLHQRGLIPPEAMTDYRRLMGELYGPKLREIGSDPAAGVYAADAPDRQKLRQELVSLVLSEGDDAALRQRLATAAAAYLAGDRKALDQGFLSAAFGAYVKTGGVEAARSLSDKALSSEDTVFRNAAMRSVAGTGRADVATWALNFTDPRLRPTERLYMLASLASSPETRDIASDRIFADYDKLAAGNGIFLGSRLPSILSASCSAARGRPAGDTARPQSPKTRRGRARLRAVGRKHPPLWGPEGCAQRRPRRRFHAQGMRCASRRWLLPDSGTVRWLRRHPLPGRILEARSPTSPASSSKTDVSTANTPRMVMTGVFRSLGRVQLSGLGGGRAGVQRGHLDAAHRSGVAGHDPVDPRRRRGGRLGHGPPTRASGLVVAPNRLRGRPRGSAPAPDRDPGGYGRPRAGAWGPGPLRPRRSLAGRSDRAPSGMCDRVRLSCAADLRVPNWSARRRFPTPSR